LVIENFSNDVDPLGSTWQGCPNNHPKSEKSYQRIPSHLPSLLLLIFYGLLEMTTRSNVPDPDPELINAQNLDFAKPKLFFKNISCYAATSTYIHVQITFNFTTFFNPKTLIATNLQQITGSSPSLNQSLMSVWPPSKAL
jgi:hypothetical protein